MSDTDLAFRATLDGSGFASGAQGLNGHINDLGFRTQAATGNLGSLGTVLGTLANPMTAVALAATTVGAGLAASVGMAAAWQSGMANVSKTTGLAGKDLESLSKELLDMSTSMPTAASELANIAQVAGSLGVAKENIAGFTEVAAQMSVGFEMTGEMAATQAAKILAAFSKPIDASNMTSLGNTVNAMGDNFAATETEVLDFINRASYLGTTMGQSIPNIAALGTVLISVGMGSETASTGIKSFLNTATSLTSKTGGLDNWAKLLDTSVADLQERLKSDFNMTLVETADKIAAIEDPTTRFQTAVALAGTEGATALLKLAGQADTLKSAMGKANSEWTNGTSLMKTYEAQSATLDSQMQIFWNTLNKAGVELGTVLLPTITDLIKNLTDLTKGAISAGEALYGMATEAGSSIEQVVLGTSDWLNNLMGIDTTAGQSAALDMGSMIGDTYAEGVGTGIGGSDAIPNAQKESLAGSDSIENAKDAGKLMADAYNKTIADLVISGTNKYAGDTTSYGGGPGWQSTTGTTTAGDLTLAYGMSSFYTLGGVMSSAAISFPDGSVNVKQLSYTNDPVSEAIIQANLWLKAKGQESLTKEQEIELTTGLKLTLKPDVSLWETPFTQQHMSEWLDQNKEAAMNAGGDMSEALYNGYFENEQKMMNSPELSKSWDVIMKSLANPDPANEARVAMAMNDLVRAGIIDPLMSDEIRKAASGAIDKIGDVITDKTLYLETKMKEIGSSAAKALSDSLLTETEQETLTKLADEYIKGGGNASDLMIQEIKSKDWAGLGKTMGSTMGSTMGQSFVDALTGEVKKFNIPNIWDVLKDPNLQSKISDLPDFLMNTFQPALKKSFDQQYEISKLGYDDQLTQTTKWIAQTEDAYTKHAGFFNNWQSALLDMYARNQIAADDFMAVWDGMENASTKATDSMNKQAKGYDQLQKAMQDCSECAISEFGQWQESQDDLFGGSYIGGGQDYLSWKTQQVAAIAETQRQMRAAGGLVLGQDYTQSPLLEQQIKVNLDTSQPNSAMTILNGVIDTAKKAVDPILAKVDVERSALDKLLSDISVGHTMTVSVSVDAYAGEIRAIVENAIAEALS